MTDAKAAPRAKRGGPPVWFTIIAIGSLGMAILLVLLQAVGIGVGIRVAAPTVGPTGQASVVTRGLVTEALEAAAFQVRAPQTAYRPGESRDLATVPRSLLQAVLPSEPQGGYVVVYELPGPNEADQVGRDFLAYLGSGSGAIQYPRDTAFVLRRVGQTLVFFAWSAEASPDARVAELAAALETVGTEVRP